MSVLKNLARTPARKVIALVGGAAVFAVVSASAATLGGLQTDHLGANSNDVASPIENGVAVSWDTAYDGTAQAYVVSGMTLAALDADESIPDGAEVRLTLTDASGDALGEFVSTNGGSTWTAPTGILAHDVFGASVVINGGAVTSSVTATP